MSSNADSLKHEVPDIKVTRREFLSLAVKGPIAASLLTFVPEGVLAFRYLEAAPGEFNPP